MSDDELLAGRYRTLRLIGTGGMARVFLAEDQRLGRQVAVKRLHAHSPEDIARRFQREARLGAALNHPNLVAVYDVETDGESVLIVMEHVDGTDLARELKAGRLTPQRAVAVIADVAAALDAVHDKGIVHRDVKPANVLIRADGTAKLGDLGIATLAEGTSITASGAVLGTASYMAPEQVRGEPAGPAADIFALAAVAYEAFSGERAQTGDTPVQIAHSITDAARARRARELARRARGGGRRAAVGDGGAARGPAAPRGRPGRRARGLRGGRGRAADAGLRPPTAVTRPAPAPPPAATHRGGSGRAAPIAFAAAALVVVAAAVFVFAGGGGDDGGGGGGAEVTETAASRPQATETTEAPASHDSARHPARDHADRDRPLDRRPGVGVPAQRPRLRAARRRGDAAGAVPLLQRSVDAFPDDSTELNHAFALFNLAQALRQTGRAAEAVPLLEKRLSFSDNQRKVVEKELKAARKDAGG